MDYDRNSRRDNILQQLRNGVLTFRYEKVSDGSTRLANGTLKESLIPEDHKIFSDLEVLENTEVIRYFDMDSNGWRSFRVDNVLDLV